MPKINDQLCKNIDLNPLTRYRSVNHQACGGYAMDDIRLLHRTSTQGDQPFA
jgi:hypothetical protein